MALTGAATRILDVQNYGWMARSNRNERYVGTFTMETDGFTVWIIIRVRKAVFFSPITPPTQQLFTLNLTTSLATHIQDLSIGGANFNDNIHDLTWHSDQLYGVTQANRLCTINTNTGVVTLLGDALPRTYRGLASHNDTLYATDGSRFYSLDATDGTSTDINTTSGFGVGENQARSLGVYGDGNLYMVGNSNTAIYQMNVTNGMATRQGNVTGFNASVAETGAIMGLGSNLYMVAYDGSHDRLYQLVDPNPPIPTVNCTLTAPAGTQRTRYHITAAFAESVTGFAESDISVSNGVASHLVGSGRNYLFTVAPTQNTNGNNIIDITGQVVNTDNRDANVITPAVTVAYDTRTVSATMNAPANTQIGSYTVTITFAESVAGFTIDDILVTNGRATNLTGSGANYSFTVTPNPSTAGANIITISGFVRVGGMAGSDRSVVATPISVSFNTFARGPEFDFRAGLVEGANGLFGIFERIRTMPHESDPIEINSVNVGLVDPLNLPSGARPAVFLGYGDTQYLGPQGNVNSISESFTVYVQTIVNSETDRSLIQRTGDMRLLLDRIVKELRGSPPPGLSPFDAIIDSADSDGTFISDYSQVLYTIRLTYQYVP